MAVTNHLCKRFITLSMSGITVVITRVILANYAKKYITLGKVTPLTLALSQKGEGTVCATD